MSDAWVYRHTETTPEGFPVYTVGFYSPDGTWHPESDHNDADDAAQRVRRLNGSGDRRLIAELRQILTTDSYAYSDTCQQRLLKIREVLRCANSGRRGSDD